MPGADRYTGDSSRWDVEASTRKKATGSPPRMLPEMRPCAVRARSSRLTAERCRIGEATAAGARGPRQRSDGPWDRKGGGHDGADERLDRLAARGSTGPPRQGHGGGDGDERGDEGHDWTSIQDRTETAYGAGPSPSG